MSVNKFNRFMLTALTFFPVIYMTVDRWWLGVLWLVFGVAWVASSWETDE